MGLLAALVGAGGLLTAPAQSETLRIAAWNILWFPGGQIRDVTPEMEAAQMEQARKVVRELNPDIMLNSEIRDWKSVDQMVSVVPGLKVANVSAFRDRDFGHLWLQQVTIASKLPVIAAWYEDWRPTIPSLSRGFSFAALEVPGGNGKVYLVYSLHLKSNRSWNDDQAATNFRLRNESISQLLRHLEDMERIMFRDRIAGVIVGGDINTNEDNQFGDEVVKMMVDAGFHNTWKGVARDKRLTWRGNEQFEATTFDYIFTKGLPAVTARMVEVPAEASDHHVVLIEIKR